MKSLDQPDWRPPTRENLFGRQSLAESDRVVQQWLGTPSRLLQRTTVDKRVFTPGRWPPRPFEFVVIRVQIGSPKTSGIGALYLLFAKCTLSVHWRNLVSECTYMARSRGSRLLPRRTIHRPTLWLPPLVTYISFTVMSLSIGCFRRKSQDVPQVPLNMFKKPSFQCWLMCKLPKPFLRGNRSSRGIYVCWYRYTYINICML